MNKIIDLTNQVFGRWTVINYSRTENGVVYWNCKCQCDNKKSISGSNLKRGLSTSCGCYSKEVSIKHAEHKTPTYNSWGNMIGRCERPSQPNYEDYGGRGVKVCEEWRNSYVKFKEDMGERPFGKTIDRINVNGNYEPSNCKWSDNIEQQNNKTNSVKVNLNGEELTIKQLSVKLGIPERTLWSRRLNNRPLF